MTVSRLMRIARLRVVAVWRKDSEDAYLAQELAFHFEHLVEENRAEGMSEAEARAAARLAFGGEAHLEDECRDHRRVGWIHDLWQDSLHGLRVLRQNQRFTAIAVASLALGIGANTAIVGVAESLLLRKLPFADPARIAVIRTYAGASQNANATLAEYAAWRDQSSSLESISATLMAQKEIARADGTSERVQAAAVTPSLFPVLGVQPLLGRVFTATDARLSIVLSYWFWQRSFGGDRDILHRRLRVNGADTEIIGVMPQGFFYPNETPAFWEPLRLPQGPLNRTEPFYLVTARLKPGATIPQAKAELQEIGSRPGWRIQIQAVRDSWYGWVKEPLLTLQSAVGLMLLIACANVAGLLLARGSARRAEIAMRIALGAGRGRILRQLLTESVLLALLGGLAGILVAWAGLYSTHWITPPPGAPRLAYAGLDLGVFAYSTFLSIATGVLFGLAPALAALRLDLARTVKESAPGTGIHSSRSGARTALVAAQIGIAFVLLIGSGLLIRSFLRFVGHDLHFDPQGILTFDVQFPPGEYLRNVRSEHGGPMAEIGPAPSRTFQRIFERLRQVPGAESVAGISFVPVNSLVLPTVTVVGRSDERAAYFLVTPGFFAAMKTPLLSGREFTDGDTAAQPWAAVVNESAARLYWPGHNPIGQRFTLDVGPDEQVREVVGLVPDIPPRRDGSGPQAVVYAPFLQQPARYTGAVASMFGQMTFLMRRRDNPMSLVPSVRQAVAEIDRTRSVGRVSTVERYLGGRVKERQGYAFLLGLFALASTLLSALGVYGVVAYAVAERTREIGIRIALGARPQDVLALAGRQALLLIACGLAVGFVAGLWAARLIAPQLWGVTPTDPLTLAAASALLIGVAVFAAYVPARRAIMVEPTVALRSQ